MKRKNGNIASHCKCGNPVRAIGQRYCRECHNASMRKRRPKHSELTAEQKKKANARSYANNYQRRGILTPEPCEKCYSTNDIQKHHEDYDKPLEVKWLCRQCHTGYHLSE